MELNALFDALDWTPDSERDGFVAWEDFVDLMLVMAKTKKLSRDHVERVDEKQPSAGGSDSDPFHSPQATHAKEER